jgi:hypothetical protein
MRHLHVGRRKRLVPLRPSPDEATFSVGDVLALVARCFSCVRGDALRPAQWQDHRLGLRL